MYYVLFFEGAKIRLEKERCTNTNFCYYATKIALFFHIIYPFFLTKPQLVAYLLNMQIFFIGRILCPISNKHRKKNE